MSNLVRFFTIPAIISLTFFTLFYQSQIAYKAPQPQKNLKQVESLRSGSMIRDIRKLPSLKLQDDNGFDITSSSFEGQWSLFFFGYATCPDFCPQILKHMDAIGRFIPDEHLKKYFVTINPENDSPKVMRDFLTVFPHHIHGLTGDKEQIFSMIDFFRITADTKANYQGHIEHSATLVLLSPQGHMCGIFNDLEDTKSVIDDIYYIQRTL